MHSCDFLKKENIRVIQENMIVVTEKKIHTLFTLKKNYLKYRSQNA